MSWAYNPLLPSAIATGSNDYERTLVTLNAVSGGDGEIYANDATWSTVYGATSGTAENTSTTAAVYTEPGYYIGRVFLPFDTSSLPDSGITITSAVLRVYVGTVLGDGDDDGNDFIRLVESTQASSTSLVSADFDQVDANALANDIDISSISVGYIEFNLNTAGIALINAGGYTNFALREGHDVSNDPVDTSITGVRINTSDNSLHKPELVITYSSSSPKTETLTDDFGDNSLDATWSPYTIGTASVSETNNQIEVDLVSASDYNYAGIISVDAYDLNESYLRVKIPAVADQSTQAETYVRLRQDSNNYIEFYFWNGDLYFRETVDGSTNTFSSVTYNSTDHLYVGFSATGGDVVWETSDDGTTWTTQELQTATIGLSFLYLDIGAGTYQTETSPGTVIFDNVNVTSITTTRNQTGVATIAASTTRDQTGVSRIENTVTANQTGKGRISVTVSHDQAGVSRISITTSNTQTGISRVTATSSQPQTGVSRVQSTTSRDITGLSRIQLTTSRTQDGITRITRQFTQDQTGISRIQLITSRTQTGVSRLTASVSVDQTGVARVQVTTSSNQTGVARIEQTASHTQLGVANIESPTKDRDQTGVARIEIVSQQTQSGTARISVTSSQDQIGKSNILNTSSRTQTGVARITVVASHDQAGVASVLRSSSQDQNGVARIAVQVDRDQDGIARITAVVTRDQTGVATIFNDVTQQHDQTGISRVTATSTKTQDGVSRIEELLSRTQIGVSRILVQTAQTQSGKSRIQITTQRTQSGVAMIVRLFFDEKPVAHVSTGVPRVGVGAGNKPVVSVGKSVDGFINYPNTKPISPETGNDKPRIK